ncbi:anthrax toxin lethal factor-related metalloendopeptidase [Paenibacillus sp. FA6]|uniref:anthrax toxin lethal factor-related metalloendopeptidase n=1 Tax=Paenibacillus sp. FA6 TaxID=3413029 RepID=UPI003F6574EC
MKWTKRILAILIIFTLFGVLPTQSVHAKSLLLDQLVVLPTGDYNVKEANAMIGRIEKIPAPILKTLSDKGVTIKLTNDIITNVPELLYLKGVTPRGWEGTGLTWDDVPGVSEKVVVVRIGYSKKGKGHSSFNLEIHETMHAVDRFVFNGASSTEDFKNIFNQEASVNYNKDGYVSVYPEEYFAEAASLYLYNDTTREELKKSTPLTYNYMDKLFNS